MNEWMSEWRKKWKKTEEDWRLWGEEKKSKERLKKRQTSMRKHIIHGFSANLSRLNLNNTTSQ